ncbi:MAG: ACT domain-containing protein [Intrasporangium sp.]|uniref:glycine cleavage system protein R n=1 Tax=Intrasporangium sp. TaxID=1925024 RepID=UPI002648079D|nr:ACT domain-containing protein [Intrasporangium sp.]MDN5798089.1 ACT domain-containing protein [Intrasporangium sp.]
MPKLVLTVIGDDRAGLVEALSQVVTDHAGNWEDSQMAELAGKFAGIVVVTVPKAEAEALTDALRGLDGLLEVSAHPGAEAEQAEPAEGAERLTIDVLGNDRPGIVHDVSAVLAEAGLSIERMSTESRDAPMAGGRLFEAHVVVRVPSSVDLAAVRAGLERLATELLVDIEVTGP